MFGLGGAQPRHSALYGVPASRIQVENSRSEMKKPAEKQAFSFSKL